MITTKRAAHSLAALFLSFIAGVPAAEATYTITMTQSGADVVASGSGTLNLTSLVGGVPGNAAAYVQANTGSIYVGPTSLTAVRSFTGGVTGPANFGSGAFLVANSGSGNIAGIDAGAVAVPNPYASGSSISGTATWTGQTFAGLGLTPGTYTWTWGSGANADSLVLQIGPPAASAVQPVPALSGWGVIALGCLIAVFGLAWTRRQRL
jgi:IPTL-CTERM motif